MLKFKENDCLHRIIKANSNDTRKLSKLVGEITRSNKANPMPDAPSDKELAENFAQFFKQKIDEIRYQFKHILQYKVPPKDLFATITENDLLKLIMDMTTKTCKSEIIPTKLLHEVLPTIIPALTKIANLSIKNGVFSKKWKICNSQTTNKITIQRNYSTKLQSCQQTDLHLQSC